MQPEKQPPARRRKLEQERSQVTQSLLDKANELAQTLPPEHLALLEQSSPLVFHLVQLAKKDLAESETRQT